MNYDGLEQIDKEYAIRDKNEKYFDYFLKYFFNYINDIEAEYNISYDYNESSMKKFKEEYIYDSKYLNIFFNILKNYNYNMNNEIKDVIKKLGNLNNPNKNKYIIKKFLNSPYIDDIYFNNKDTYKIFSEKLGNYEFELFKSKYSNNKDIINYMKKNDILNDCFQNSYYLSKKFPNMNSITSKLKCCFIGSFYHCYTYDPIENKIINLCSNSIMDKNQYDRLYKTKEILNIPNTEIENMEKEVNKNSNIDKKIYTILRLALYEEHKNKVKIR